MNNANDLRPGEYKHIPELGVYRAKNKAGKVDAFKSEAEAKTHTQHDPFKGMSSSFRSAGARKKTNLYGNRVNKSFHASPKLQTTKKGTLGEASVSKKDPREYGYEGEMAMSQLKGIIMHAEQLHDMLEPDTDLPEWVQSKITLAYDYIQTATDYMSTELDESKEFYAAGREYPNLVDNVWAARMQESVNEEVPANNAGGGNIAGIGVGPKGEPGVTRSAMDKYKKKNTEGAPKAGRKTLSLFMQGE
jgi:hypothetical protein